MATIYWLDWTLIILGVFIAVNLLINVKWPYLQMIVEPGASGEA